MTTPNSNTTAVLSLTSTLEELSTVKPSMAAVERYSQNGRFMGRRQCFTTQGTIKDISDRIKTEFPNDTNKKRKERVHAILAGTSTLAGQVGMAWCVSQIQSGLIPTHGDTNKAENKATLYFVKPDDNSVEIAAKAKAIADELTATNAAQAKEISELKAALAAKTGKGK